MRDNITPAEVVFEGEVLGVEAVFFSEGVREGIGVWFATSIGCHDKD